MRMNLKNRWLLCGLSSLGLMSAFTSTLHADGKAKEENEVKMKIDEIPSAVKATIVKEADGTAVTTVDKEMLDGKTVYEADAKIGGTNYEIVVAEDGTLISKKIDKEEDEKKDGEKKPDEKKMQDKEDKD